MQPAKTARFGNRLFQTLAIVTVLIGALCNPQAGHGAGTVTNLNWLDLDEALAGGGTVKVECDGAIYKPYVTKVSIGINTVIDATGHKVILDGWSGWGGQMFSVASGVTLTLSNVTIANCMANTNGGAIANFGTLNLYRCTFSNNWAQGISGTNGATGAEATSGTAGSGTAGTIGKDINGGAIYSQGTLVINGGSFQGNVAIGGAGGSGGDGGNATTGTPGSGGTGAAGGLAQGGAIFTTNSVAITNCFFDGNFALGGRGGYGGSGGLSFSAAGNNGVGGIGGDGFGAGLYVYRNAIIVDSTFFLQFAVGGSGGDDGLTLGASTSPAGPKGGNCSGGAIFNAGTNSIINCTFDENVAIGGDGGAGGAGPVGGGGTGGAGGVAWGGAIYSTNQVALTNCTLAWNATIGGPGGYGGLPAGVDGADGTYAGANMVRTNGTFTLKNSIFAGGTGVGGNGTGTFVDAGQNISDDNSITLTGTGSLSATDPLVATFLNSNGGEIQTLALFPGSPATDAADPAAAPKYDQRGFVRVGTADIGAYESGSATLRVFAAGQTASLDGDVGLFVLGGMPATLTPFTANYTVGGTASNGVDYVQITNTVIIPTVSTNGANYVRIPIRGLSGAFTGTNKSVVVTLAAGTNYQISANDPLNPNMATVTLSDHSTFDASRRYDRGTSTAFDFHSFVVPLNFQTGVRLDASGGAATNLFPGNPWTSLLYHFDATNAALQTNLTGRLPFQNPIVAFGSPVGGSPLYVNQNYGFGFHAGEVSTDYSNALRIQVYYRSNAALAGTISLPILDQGVTGELADLATNGFTQTVEQFGLRSVLHDSPGVLWGLLNSRAYVFTHTATSDVATNYYYVVEAKGTVLVQPLVLNPSGEPDYARLYVMEFSPFPAGRAQFVDQPHFDGKPLPPAYQGKSLEELTNVSATLPDLSAVVASNYLTLDQSPELRRHPILDQFVADMRNDPLALANYVINEIGLVDAIDYDTNYNSLPAVNLGGINRSALATFQEGQGSPVEQCALLIYLLRQAGVPATYVYPTNGGLQMLDFQASKLLRMQLAGALSPLGQTNLPHSIALNYPWVAAYLDTNWVQVFPWLKDTEIIEGLNVYDYLPTNYNSGFKWLQAYIAGDTNIFSLSDSDQPFALLPKFIQKNLNDSHYGLSVDDMGVRIINRKHLYSQWSDFPKPFSLSGTPLVIESLKTNLNLFNTVRIQAYSENDPGKMVDSTEMRVAELHNRRLMLKFDQVGTANVHDMILSLAPYSPDVTNTWAFDTRADPTWKLSSTNRLASTDDNIIFKVTHKRLRFLPNNYIAPEPAANSNLLGYTYFEQGDQSGQSFVFTDTFRKGDLITFCMDLGWVTTRMLNVHAQEIWRFNQTASTNQPATIDPDIYLGTTAYLMGMSYFHYVNQFDEFNDRLHKVQVVSQYRQGYGLIRPQRDAGGALISGGEVNPITPSVHMPNNGFGTIFNQSLHPDSGADAVSATLDWWMQNGVQGSAAEHGILRSYVQTNASSTVSLLQQVGTNKVTLTSLNFTTAGEVLYNGVALKDADSNTWDAIVKFFADNGPEAVAYVTPGNVTNGTYQGMGALCVSASSFAALVSGLNGGVSDSLPANTFAYSNALNITIRTAPDGSISPFQLFTTLPAVAINGAAPTWDLFSAYTSLLNGQQFLDPALQYTSLQLQQSYGASGDAPVYNQLYNLGAASSEASAYNDASQRASDPVNVMNGEFYIDSVDLSLPGPMPLQIRRNYGSQNLAENEFGFGWKMNYVPFLSVGTNATLIYGIEMDGSAVAYRQTTTNASVWLPTPQDNPTLNNNSSLGIGSVVNLFNNRLQLATVSGTNVYTLTGADGSVRTFTVRSYPIGSFTRERPYLDTWRDHRGNFHTCEYGTDATQPDYGEVRRIQSSNGNYLGFYYDVYGHIIEAYTGDGRRLQYEYDKYGDLVTVTFPDLAQIRYEYQHANQITNSVTNVYSTHLIVRELKPDGRVLQNIYDSERRVTNQLATVGPDLNLVRNATFAFTNNFSLTAPTNLLTGVTVVYDYTNRPTTYCYTNSLIRLTVDPLGGTEVQDWYETNSAGGFQRSLKSRLDKRGLQTAYLYDASGNVTNTTFTGDLLGFGTNSTAVTTAIYDTNNLPLQITDPVGNSAVYVYDPEFIFQPRQIIRLAGSTAISTNLSEYVNVTNVVTLGSSQMTNRAFGMLSREIRAYGSLEAATNQWFRDGRGFITNAVQFTGTSDPNVTNQFRYNDREELAERTDGAGRRYRFAYDDMGRPIGQETYEAGQTVPLNWSYSYYNENGELKWSDGPRFGPEDYVWRDYDGAGRSITEIHWRSEAKADGSGVQAPAEDNLYATSFRQYDPFSNLTRTIEPRGNYSLKFYDAIGQLTREEFYNADGSLLSTNGFVYNLAGDVTNAFNALGGSTPRQFTSTGKPSFQRNPDGSTNAWQYYLDGRPRREVQGNGAYWESTYDEANRKTTRIFYSAAAVPLATNAVVLDRRGNLIQRVDAAGNSSTNFYDGLDRLKVSAGPAVVTVEPDCPFLPNCGVYVTNVLQHSITTYYTVGGVWQTNVNALGEKAITQFDALSRAIHTEIRAANNTLVRETTTSYSADHHSVTITNGSGPAAIVSTTYTDNNGQNLLSIAYPTASSREFTLRNYDLTGNLSSQEQDSITNGVVTTWSTASYLYDGLNRPVQQSDRDGAITYFSFDALGNVTNRTMPGGLQWQARYNNAGQLLEEKNVGAGGVATLTNSYTYFAGGNPFAGALQTRTDGVGVTCTYAYDDYFRVVTNLHVSPISATNDAETVWTYDVRGLVTGISESFPNNFEGVNVSHTFDTYGQLVTETVERAGGDTTATQSWDAAGRRSRLFVNGRPYTFGWRADGLLTSVAMPGASASYSYNSAGILTNRFVGSRSTTVTALDGTGRPLAITNTVSSIAKLTETLNWTGDGRLNAHTLDRMGDFTDSRTYVYADLSRRLIEERLNLDATKRWTNAFAYDGGTAGGPGALTAIGPVAAAAQWSGGTDSFSRINAGTNTFSVRSAYGRVNGNSTITAALDGQPIPLTVANTYVTDWPLGWRAAFSLSPGAHQLTVSAAHPSGQFTTNRSVWFTNNIAHEAVADTYDAAGRMTCRVWKNPNGTTNRIQSLTWDVKGRLAQVAEFDSQNNGYGWQATYDALGRKIFTQTTYFTNDTQVGDVVYSESYFDPAAEFLELGVAVIWQSTNWKLYGPDLNGVYGGMNGVGGLEGTSMGIDPFQPTMSDARGNVLGAVTNGIAVNWNSARPTGYGTPPNYRPAALTAGASVAQSSAWRGRRPEATGYIYLGARYYDPESGRFLSDDPFWNGRDPNYYTFAGGDPINFFDADGRCASSAKTWQNDWSLSDYLVRKENPLLVEQRLASGYPEPPGGSLVDTVLRGSHDAGYPASTTPGGAPNINGEPLWINVDQVTANGGTIAQNPQILQAMRDTGVPEAQIRTYQGNLPIEGEVVIQGGIPASAVNTRSMMVMTRGAQGLGIIAAGASGWNLGQSINRSIDQGTPRPVIAQTVREVGGWGGAWAGFQVAGGISFMAGVETGPGALVTGLVGGVVGGYIGYQGGNAIGGAIERGGH